MTLRIQEDHCRPVLRSWGEAESGRRREGNLTECGVGGKEHRRGGAAHPSRLAGASKWPSLRREVEDERSFRNILVMLG